MKPKLHDHIHCENCGWPIYLSDFEKKPMGELEKLIRKCGEMFPDEKLTDVEIDILVNSKEGGRE